MLQQLGPMKGLMKGPVKGTMLGTSFLGAPAKGNPMPRVEEM